MVDDKDEELELDVNQSKSSKTTTILLIVLIGLVLVIGGIGAWFLLGNDSGGDSSSDLTETTDTAEEVVLEPITYLTLVPEFVVNFGPGSSVKYLQVDLQIATRDESVLETVNAYRPVIRNDILVLLSGYTFTELSERAGKEALQKNILNTINRIIISANQSETEQEPKDEEENAEAESEATNEAEAEAEDVSVVDTKNAKGPIENVYFTSFIMQ